MTFHTPIHTSLQSIERVINAGLPVVLIFWRDKCDPCRQLDPTLSWLADDYAGKILFAKIDADNEPELVSRYHIDRLPGLVFVKEGQALATAFGALAEGDLKRWCEYLTAGGVQPPTPNGPSEKLNSSAAPVATAPANSGPAQASGKPIRLADANFDAVINGSLPVLVDFWAPWCGPCHMVAPVVEQLAQEFAGKLVVGKLNVDENQQIASRYGVMSIPTIMIFRNGKAVDSVVGALPAQVLRQRVLPYVN